MVLGNYPGERDRNCANSDKGKRSNFPVLLDSALSTLQEQVHVSSMYL